MKIAVFYYVNFSGAKRVVAEHVKGLVALGNTVDVYTTDSHKDIFNPGLYASNVYLYNFSPRKFNVSVVKRVKEDFYDTFFVLKNLHRKIAMDIDKAGYDIVLLHTDIHTQAPFLLRYLKTKNVYFCLEPLRNAYEYSLRLAGDFSIFNKAYETLNRWIRKNIDRENTLSADHVVTLSLFARERIIASYDLYPEISYLGIDESVFKPIKIDKKKQILFVANKEFIYGYDLAKKAVDRIPKKIRPELKIINWKKHNSERISDVDLVRTYNESLIVLSLSRFDTFGLVPLESMACAVPVIALNVAGYRETIVDSRTGYLVDFNPEEISEKIVNLISNQNSAREMGENGRKWILDKWTWRMRVKRLNDLLQKYSGK